MGGTIRELLMEWYSMIRHSVNCKILVRFPKRVMLVKAQMLQQEYTASSLRRQLVPEPVEITGRWLNDLLREYRISDRKPNRKFKVPRWVLAERLEIWWLNVFKLRKLVQLHFGYDPVARIVINTSALDHSNAIHCKPCVCVCGVVCRLQCCFPIYV